jgi:hypothetical protein
MSMQDLRVVTSLFFLALALPASAAQQTVLDYRKENSQRPPIVTANTRATLASALPDNLKDVAVLSHIRGRVSNAATSEDIYLVADKAPVAAEPFALGPAQLLVTIKDGKTSVWKLPEELRYQRIAGTVDANRDGHSELLLEAVFYNMGQSVLSVDLVALGANGSVAIRQSLKDVVTDSCDNPVGRREKRASTIALGDDGKLVAKQYRKKCS